MFNQQNCFLDRCVMEVLLKRDRRKTLRKIIRYHTLRIALSVSFSVSRDFYPI